MISTIYIIFSTIEFVVAFWYYKYYTNMDNLDIRIQEIQGYDVSLLKSLRKVVFYISSINIFICIIILILKLIGFIPWS